jgi:hypothetical protein
MFGLDDLGQVAQDLRKRGIDAWHDFLYCPHGCIEGLDVGDDFFPLWELRLAENEAALISGDFAAILRRRSAEWTVEGSARMRQAAG